MVDTYKGILFSLQKEILAYVTTLMNLEDIMLTETNQSPKTNTE
jgi:hypothetical protein